MRGKDIWGPFSLTKSTPNQESVKQNHKPIFEKTKKYLNLKNIIYEDRKKTEEEQMMYAAGRKVKYILAEEDAEEEQVL